MFDLDALAGGPIASDQQPPVGTVAPKISFSFFNLWFFSPYLSLASTHYVSQGGRAYCRLVRHERNASADLDLEVYPTRNARVATACDKNSHDALSFPP